MENLQNQLISFLLEQGAADVGFSRVDDGPDGLNYAITIVARLSDAVIDEITTAPTYTYFHHYRTVNQFLDQLALKAGFMLAEHDYRYINIAASQSVPSELGLAYQGRYSHKKAAVLAGLGSIGKNCLFLHKKFGARVRLVTVFTDCEFAVGKPLNENVCLSCNKCVDACPSGAISGLDWSADIPYHTFFSPDKCSKHMKSAYQKIGRGAVCGLCMRACPVGADKHKR